MSLLTARTSPNVSAKLKGSDIVADIDRLEIEVEAAASKANKELDKLVARLEKVESKLSGINVKSLSGVGGGKSANSTANTFAKSAKKITSQILSSNQKARTSFSQLAGSFYANYFLIIRGLSKVKSALQESMDYIETYNHYDVTMNKIGKEFGNSFAEYGYDSAVEYANSFRNRLNDLTRKMTGYQIGSDGELFVTGGVGLGLDPEAIMNYQASISAVTNSVGLIGENSVNASKALTMLAADMSSLKNVELSTVMTNLQSGLIGQSRALYKYGIDITNATLQTYAYDLGLSKAVSEMTQAEKMQLRLIAILDQSKVAWGDQSNTINSVANQYRIFKQQISNLARTIGNLFLPIVQKIVPVVNGLIIALQRLFSFFGVKLWGDNWLKNIMGNSGTGGSNYIEDLGDSAEDTADGLTEASKAAEKLKTMVRGIDELNIINQDTGSGTSGSGSVGGSIDLSGAIGDALEEYESVWEEAFKNAENKAQEFADRICAAFKKAFETSDFTEIGEFFERALRESLEKINWNKVYQGARNFGKGLATFLNGLISPDLFKTLGKTIAGSLNSGLHFLNSFGEYFEWEEFGLSLSASLKGFFENWDAELTGETLSTFARGLLKSFKGAIDGMANDDVFKDIGQKIVELICGIDWGTVLWDLSGLFRSLTRAIVEFPADLLSGIGQEIVDKIFGEGTFDVEIPEFNFLPDSISGPLNAFSRMYDFFNGEKSTGFVDNWKKQLNKWQNDTESARKEENIAWGKFYDDVSEGSERMHDGAGRSFDEWAADSSKKRAVEKHEIEHWVSEIDSSMGSKWKSIGGTISTETETAKNKANNAFGNMRSTILTETETARSKANSSFINMRSAISTESETAKTNVSSAFGNMRSTIKKETETSSTSVTNLRNSIRNLIDKLSELFGWSGRSLSIGLPTSSFGSFISAASNVISKIRELISYDGKEVNVKSTIHYSSTGEVHGGGGRAFATGGHPETGEVFLARENGLNEMVGRIGTRHTVANNDQIVEGISTGVYDAVVSAMSQFVNANSSQTVVVETTVEMDGKTIVEQTDKARRRMGWNFQPI